MREDPYRCILFSVGTLPFWSGKTKLIKLLTGNPGSLWKRETPLKSVYINQPFFGSLSEQSESEIRRALQNLMRTGYLKQEPLRSNKPHRVIKFSEKGVKKYYNLLVIEKGFDEPFWWLHHVSRLTDPTNTPINTGGEILTYNEETYLTQTPDYRTDTQRMQSDQTLRLLNPDWLREEQGHFQLQSLEVRAVQATSLTITGRTRIKRIPPADLGRKLNHFGTGQSQLNPPNPYLIKGTLVQVDEPGDEGKWRLRLKNENEDTLTVIAKSSKIPDELTLKQGNVYEVGPVRETPEQTSGKENFEVTLREDGEIQSRR